MNNTQKSVLPPDVFRSMQKSVAPSFRGGPVA